MWPKKKPNKTTSFERTFACLQHSVIQSFPIILAFQVEELTKGTHLSILSPIVYHKCEVKLKMWAMNLGKAVEVPKLNEAMAIELGATLLGEAIIFVSGAVLVTAEVVRRNNKDAAIEKARRDEIQSITDRLREMEIESSRQDAQLREITRLCMALQGTNQVVEWATTSSVTDDGVSVNNPAPVALESYPRGAATAATAATGNSRSRGIVHQALALICNE